MTPAELKEVLELHRKWRRGEEGGARANLAGANLTDAYLAGANLADANLARANLAGANLADANLAGANLTDANLTDAYLADANLAGAYLADANLAGANLAGAYLADAYLADAYLADANLAGAYLTGAYGVSRANAFQGSREEWVKSRAKTPAERAQRFRERNPDVPVVPSLDRAILAAIEAGGGLDMGDWHVCDTTHCRAGWAIHLAGDAGYALEKEHGSQRAGAMIYRASTGRVPHFFASNEVAMEDIRVCAAADAQESDS